MTTLKTGDMAPDFRATTQNGDTLTLADLRGQRTILYFYPKDNTPGCTRQACAFAARNTEFAEKNAVVVGISKDGRASHLKFAEKYSLPFILLSDENLDVIKAYGAWKNKKLYGRTFLGVVRTTYVIDENGIVIAAMPKVKPDTNAEEVLAMI